MKSYSIIVMAILTGSALGCQEQPKVKSTTSSASAQEKGNLGEQPIPAEFESTRIVLERQQQTAARPDVALQIDVMLRSGCGTCAAAAFDTLISADAGQVATPILVKELTSAEERERRQAAFYLGAIGRDAKAAIPALVDALEDPSDRVRRAAADALGQLTPLPASALAAIRNALTTGNGGLRVHAARALWKTEGRTADVLPLLISAMNEKDENIRKLAAETLGDIGADAKDAVPSLLDATRVRYFPLKLKAIEALGNIGPEAKAAVPRLVHMLKHSDDDTRIRAAITLWHIEERSEPVVLVLRDILRKKQSGAYARREAAIALGRIGRHASKAIPVLTAGLDDDDLSVKINCCAALWQVTKKGDLSVPVLAEILNPASYQWARREAATHLGMMGNDAKTAVPALIRALEDDAWRVRAAAARALGKVTPVTEDAVEALRRARNDKADSVRICVEGALRQIAPGK